MRCPILNHSTLIVVEQKICTSVPIICDNLCKEHVGAQWLSGRVLDSRPRGRGFEPHRRHCVVSSSKNINPSLVLVLP